MDDATTPATDRTLGFLRDLADRQAIFGLDVKRAETITMVEQKIAAGITQEEASALITAAGRAPRHAPADRPAETFVLNGLRGLAESSALYGLGVSREETIRRVEAFIAAGPNAADAYELRRIAYAAKPHPTEKSPLPLSVIEGIDGLTISEGHYAAFFDDVLRFYRVYTPATGEYRDQPVMRRFASSNLTALYPEEARPVLHAIDADPDTAAFRFADEFTRCWVCGRMLTDAVSRLLSVGPHCRGFHNHSGLRAAASEVDKNPARRHVYRAVRDWALDQGFKDPRNKEERESMQGQMTASRLASAWSGLPGLLSLPRDEAVEVIKRSVTGDIDPRVEKAMLDAPADTLAILVESGVLSPNALTVLTNHRSAKVREMAGEFFLSILGDLG